MPRRRSRGSALTFADMMAVHRIGQVAVAPDGRRAVYVVAKHDPKENRVRHTIRLIDLSSGAARDLTPGPGNHRDPAWSPDGTRLAFVSDREKDEGAQLWVMPVKGGEARRVTSGYGGVSAPLWAPDGRRIAFTRRVVVSPDHRSGMADSDPRTGPPRAKVYGLVNQKSSARIADELLFRHWDSWRDRRRHHIFLVDVETGRLGDLTPFDRDAPPIGLGSDRDYDFSPDGGEIAFVMNPDRVVARSTNNSIYLQKIRGVARVGEPKSISNSEACDCHPRYAPDGSRLCYLAMSRKGYEADRNRIKAYHRKSGRTAVHLAAFDRNPQAFEIVSAETILFLAQDRGRQSVYRLDLAGGRVRQLTAGASHALLRVIPRTDDLLVGIESTTAPVDLYRLRPPKGFAPDLRPGPAVAETGLGAAPRAMRLTHHGEVLSDIRTNGAEDFWYAGAGGTPVHGFLIRPPSFRKGRKYPLILLIHGGPQGAFLDQFHYRWNAQLFAAHGAVVAMLNARGSTGYGQRFTDQISGDWGGRCYEDICLGVDYMLRKYRFLDGKRMAAAGASFGGFLINWIAGRSDRFRALVSHDGVFHAETMAYTTEELWFDEHEHGGMPYENRRAFLKFSPHLFVSHFRTPTLVVHSELDFRCPISEGLGMFTAMQVMGVPSRFLSFPDEGHWVLQPANAEVWYHEVIGWLTKHLGARGSRSPKRKRALRAGGGRGTPARDRTRTQRARTRERR